MQAIEVLFQWGRDYRTVREASEHHLRALGGRG